MPGSGTHEDMGVIGGLMVTGLLLCGLGVSLRLLLAQAPGPRRRGDT